MIMMGLTPTLVIALFVPIRLILLIVIMTGMAIMAAILIVVLMKVHHVRHETVCPLPYDRSDNQQRDHNQSGMVEHGWSWKINHNMGCLP